MPSMIVTEYGLTFSRTEDGWQCIQQPQLRMLLDHTYAVDDLSFGTLAGAMMHVAAIYPKTTG